MKTLPKARFIRQRKEHPEVLQFIFFGPVVKERWVEEWYDFNSLAPSYFLTKFSYEEGEKMKAQQQLSPVIVYSSNDRKIYWFKDTFVHCTEPDEDETVVKGLILDQEERRTKRLEKLRKKGEQAT